MQHHYQQIPIIVALCSIAFATKAQTYIDYFGNGHNVGISVSSSHENESNSNEDAIVGRGHFPDEKGASRFLAQATMGVNYEDIQNVASIGIENWLNSQFNMAPISFESEYKRIYDEARAMVTDNDIHKNEYLSYTFYEKLIKHPDVLRQKLAFALSQIFVISPPNSFLNNKSYANANYYDVLYLGAFGNYRDMLYNVTLHPCMGIYLSHLQNQKADIVQGTVPDENYAREIMQLFSIGLYELNLDGSFKLDDNGELIPTYDIQDIQELSRVFTGLSGSKRFNDIEPTFNTLTSLFDLREPMTMYYDFHDKREKVLLDNTVIPANQPGMSDVDTAIDFLFNHPNVGPFIGKRLIQHLVKSNPSSQYIYRVSRKFEDDGTGIRGNMQEVIKAILTDPEARDCSWLNDQSSGKLIQPVQRLTNLFLAFDISTPSNKFWYRDASDIYDKLEQAFLNSASVFNFFTPFYAEKEFVDPSGLVSPEFQILNSTSGMYYLNETENALKISPFRNRTLANDTYTRLVENEADVPVLDFTDEILAYQTGGLNSLLDRLDLLICRGQLEQGVRNIIEDTLTQNMDNNSEYDVNALIHDAIYYMMISPNYTILK